MGRGSETTDIEVVRERENESGPAGYCEGGKGEMRGSEARQGGKRRKNMTWNRRSPLYPRETEAGKTKDGDQ